MPKPHDWGTVKMRIGKQSNTSRHFLKEITQGSQKLLNVLVFLWPLEGK
jgi:hypothetical protein